MPRNLLKIPQGIIDRIRTIDVDDVMAACAKLLRPEDITKYTHLGLRSEDGVIAVPAPQIPSPKTGRYSRANVEVREVKRHDLPMISKTFYWYTPNWGDPSRGYHTSSRTRQVYQCYFYPPRVSSFQ